MDEQTKFDSVSPIDFRYWVKKFVKHLSEKGFMAYKLLIEFALVKVLSRRKICPEEVVQEVHGACETISCEEVYAEEERNKHDIRALVNCICKKITDIFRRFIHWTATSFDIVDSANAARYKSVVKEVLIPSLLKLEKVLIDLVLREVETVQIGRTHGQHAVPITFGFAIAVYVSRLGNSIEKLKQLSEELPGKFSGAVGAYNASSLFFDDPEEFEREVLAEVDLVPAEISTQVVPPEPLIRLLCEITIVAGIFANLADDMRHLQRTEIGEVGEEFGTDQVGSSTMPQKRNPINFENIKSLWKVVVSRVTMIFMDQISEHQRDLTNSASARTYGETIAYVISMTDRLTKTMGKLVVDRQNLQKNLEKNIGMIIAEPLYIILSALGCSDAHEVVRKLTLQAQREGKSLMDVIVEDDELKHYLSQMTDYQRQILSDPSLYTGIAAKKAISVANNWKEKLGI